MNYVGVDLHKRTAWFHVLDENGNKLSSKNLSTSPEILKQFFEEIPKPFTLAVETTYNWYFFVDLAREYAQEVFLANSYELKAFAKRHKKNDKIDARLIATVLQRGFLPMVTIADQKTRQIREILRYRMKLIIDRSRIIFRLKALMDALGMTAEGDFTTYKKLRQIETSSLCDAYRKVILGYCEQIEALNRRIFDLQKDIKTVCLEDPDISHLISIPGLSYFSAALIKTEIIDISRFKSFNRLCAYAGLAPRVSASADKIHHGPLNKNRRKHLQWILLEVAIHFIKALPEKKVRFQMIQKRKGSNTAKVALARDMLKVIYHVLKEKRDFFWNQSLQIQSVATAALVGV